MRACLRFLFLLSLLSAVLSAHADVTGHWRLDEASGSSAADSSASGFNGTLFGDAAFVPGGMMGNCLQLTRLGGGYVRIGNVLPLTATSYSISGWIKTTSTAEDFFVAKHYATLQSGYLLGFNANGPFGAANKALYIESTSPGNELTSLSSVTTGNWKHVVITSEFGESTKMYVDGVLEVTKPNVPVVATAADLCIGAVFFSGPGYVGYFTGLIDDVQIYNRALIASEVAFMFANPGEEVLAIKGRITQNSVGVAGAVVNIKQGSTIVGTATTDVYGDYTAGSLEPGSYTIQPTHNDKIFFPSTKDVTIAPDAYNQNFVAANIGPVSVSFQYPVVYSDQSRQGTVGLNTTSAVNRVVNLSDNSFKLTTPLTMTVPAGQQNANFFVYGVPVVVDTLVTVTANCQGINASNTITVRPKPALTTMNLAMTTIKGGRGLTGNVSIDKPAIGTMALYLSSDTPSVATISPTNTAMTNGVSAKNFYCKTFPVVSTQLVTFTATFYGSTTTKQLTVTP
ncbi:MAG: LamG-like jellyroll fold domain-containing protein [Fimbriimonadaceae bacterium]